MLKLPNVLYSASGLREIESVARDVFDITPDTLMQRAGSAAFACLREHWPQAKRVNVLCGGGNNGGDGYVVARLAKDHGLSVQVLATKSMEGLKGEALTAAKAAERSGVPFRLLAEAPDLKADLIVDGLVGNGLQGAISKELQGIIDEVNGSGIPVLALDVPSGLDGDTGSVGSVAIKADVTITFLGVSPGLLTGLGPTYCGKLCFDDLDVPQNAYRKIRAVAHRLDLVTLKHHFATRPKEAHKGYYGHVLVVGGNHGMPGAVRLAAEAALRVGAGKVSVATRPEHIACISSTRPEIMCYGFAKNPDITSLLDRATVVVVGPGLGLDEWAQTLWRQVLSADKPMVVDADALQLLANHPEKRGHWILTPHPGEASKLLGCSAEEVQRQRMLAIEKLSHTYGGVIVLKGVGTLVLGDAEMVKVCSDGNPGMASGGMGDVLAGVIAGCVAQKIPISVAASLGVVLHACAGDNAASNGVRGILASDLLPYLKNLVN